MSLSSCDTDNLSTFCDQLLQYCSCVCLHTLGGVILGNQCIIKSPELSDYGRLQIEEVAETLKGLEVAHGIKVDKIISSPLIRCVQTSDIVAEALGINSISLEYGVMEEAKSFRGHPPNEPAPVWTPLVLSRNELRVYTSV